MVEFWEFKYRIKRFYKFTRQELLELLISVIVITFIWAFKGANVDSVGEWIVNYIVNFIMIAFSFWVHLTAQKLFGIYFGYRVEYRMWAVGLLLGVVVALITNGHFPLLLAGGISLMHLTRLRIGEFRYGLNTFESMKTALAGPMANLFVVMFLKFVIWQTLGIPAGWLDNMFIFNLVFAIYMMLPIPPMPGVIIFYGSKLWYVFMFAFMLMYVLLIVVFGYYSLILGLILGFVIYLVYFITTEK